MLVRAALVVGGAGVMAWLGPQLRQLEMPVVVTGGEGESRERAFDSIVLMLVVLFAYIGAGV